MNLAQRLISGLTLTSALAIGVVHAHHSVAEYDTSRVLDAAVTVEKVDWINPHSYMTVATQDTGANNKWRLEIGAPGVNLRMGWKRDTVKVGDKLNITFYPLRDGRGGGALLSATFPDGHTIHTPVYYLNRQGEPQTTAP